ncbi:TIGR04282 family arsenosugar biosynthesis glycosyltransferase [Aequorivita sp. Q41]|uniref:TIGR04282 family arsenosugar biosynthesis glycosyltransferase n=1 Tax=Aequorivita sp. Q41 TaxID=3153300 RepID=UPI0032421F66
MQQLTSKKALIIFTRNPELGKVKTRLAKTVGDESALKIYKFLLNHTVEITKKINVDKFVFYSETINQNDIWDTDIFKKKLQTGKDLGDRMNNAFLELFKIGYEKVIIIGSDMFDLDKKDLDSAFAALYTKQFVIGPATDGGYYLLGMNELNPAIFQDKNWGTSSVLGKTLENLKDEKYLLLEERNDVDYYEDIKNVEAFQQFLPSYLDKNFL